MSAQELRRRTNTTTTIAKEPSDENPVSYAAGLRVPNMLKAFPQHTGDVFKLHIPVVFSVLPRFVQNRLVQWKTASACLGLLPQWKPRFLILLGRYLYKFASAYDTQRPPKGRPLPLDALDVHLLEPGPNNDHNSVALRERPPGFQHVLVVSTLRKTHYYACATHQDATTWVNALHQAQQEAIKRAMGHAPQDSYPASWAYFDTMGSNLIQSKERIAERMEQADRQEMEMTKMGVGGPTGGYYG